MLKAWSSAAPMLLGLLRIVSGVLISMHGTSKLLGFPEQVAHAVPLFSLVGVAGALEIVGGVLLALGFHTRLVAFVLSGEMAFAYFIGHAEGLPAHRQPRRARGDVVLRVPVFLRGGGGRVQRGRSPVGAVVDASAS